jgi:hypothetical protein
MIRRFTATLLGAAAAMTFVGGVALAAPGAGQPVALAALSTPLPAQPPGPPGPPHPNPPPGHPNPGGPNHPGPPPGPPPGHPGPPPGPPGPPPGHPGPPPGHPGPPPGHPGPPPPGHFPPPPPPHHFFPGHDRAHPGWRYDPNWGWWPGVVTPDQCQDGHGHVNWNDHECIGGRFGGFRVS